MKFVSLKRGHLILQVAVPTAGGFQINQLEFMLNVKRNL